MGYTNDESDMRQSGFFDEMREKSAALAEHAKREVSESTAWSERPAQTTQRLPVVQEPVRLLPIMDPTPDSSAIIKPSAPDLQPGYDIAPPKNKRPGAPVGGVPMLAVAGAVLLLLAVR